MCHQRRKGVRRLPCVHALGSAQPPANLCHLPRRRGHFAERIKALTDEAQSAVADACGQQAGELALGASQTIAQYLLPTMIASFRHEQPKVHMTARSGNSDQMLEAPLAREVHLALI